METTPVPASALTGTPRLALAVLFLPYLLLTLGLLMEPQSRTFPACSNPKPRACLFGLRDLVCQDEWHSTPHDITNQTKQKERLIP